MVATSPSSASSAPPDFQIFTSLRYDPLLTTIPANLSSWPTTPPPLGCPFYILPYHRDRLLQAAVHFEWTDAASCINGIDGFERLLAKLQEAIPSETTAPLRVRVLLSYDGTIEVVAGPTPTTTEFSLFPARLPPPKDKISQPKVSPLTGGTLELGDDDLVHGDPPSSSPWEVMLDSGRTIPSLYTSYKTTKRDMYDSARRNVGIKERTEEREVLIISKKNNEIMEGSLTTVYFWRQGRWVTPNVESGGQIGTTRRLALEKG